MAFKDISQRPDRIVSDDGNGWEMLAAAIIRQAIDDYRIAILVRDDITIRRINKFFRSKYFSNISTLDPEWLIKELTKKYEKEREDQKRRKANLGIM